MIAEVEGLTVAYGSIQALDAVRTTIPEGATGLLGPNGAGKSTLIKALLGFVEPAAGKLRVLGWDVISDPMEVRSRVGYMAESESTLPGLNAIEATALCGELGGLTRTESLSRGHEVLAYVGLGEARYRPVASYSTGMKARVKLAQALVSDPDLLLLDEPTNGLDPQGRADMLGLVRDICRRLKIHVLLSSHLLHDVEEVCEHVILIDRGKVVEQGAIRELRALKEKRFEVALKGDTGLFRRALVEEGATVQGEDSEMLVSLCSDTGTDPILRAAVRSGGELRKLQVQERSLAEVFVAAVGEPAPAQGTLMAVFELVYQRMEGPRRRAASPAVAIAVSDLRVLRRRKLMKIATVFGGLITFVLCGFIVARAGFLNDILPSALNVKNWPEINAARFDSWFFDRNTASGYHFFLLLVALFAGSGRISEDLRSNAVALYLARPLTRVDYLLGKIAATAVPVGIGALGIPLLVWTVAALVDPQFLAGNLRTGLGLLGAGILGTAYYTAASLFFSSLVKSGRVAGVMFAGFVFLSSAVRGILGAAFRSTSLSFLGFSANFGSAGSHLLGVAGERTPPFLPALATMLVVTAVGLWTAHRRIRAVEVVA